MTQGLYGLNYITATELNQGKSSSCVKRVHDTDCDTIVIKQSNPYAVIVSYERYIQLIKAYEKVGGMNNGRTEDC